MIYFEMYIYMPFTLFIHGIKAFIENIQGYFTSRIALFGLTLSS